MTNKVIAYCLDTGDVALIIPNPDLFDAASKERQILRDLGTDFNNDQEVLEWIRNKDVPQGKKGIVLNREDLPDAHFRRAWKFSGIKIIIDIDKAKEQHLNVLREIRKPLLDRLDVYFQIAIEKNNDELKDTVVQYKNLLRNVTKIELSNDPEVLKTQIPEVLKTELPL